MAIRLASGAAGIATLAVVVSSTIALWHANSVLAADSAPDWMRAAAQDKLPEYAGDTVAVILLDEQYTTVKDNGEIERGTGAHISCSGQRGVKGTEEWQ